MVRPPQRPVSHPVLAAMLALTSFVGCDDTTTSPVDADKDGTATTTEQGTATEQMADEPAETPASPADVVAASVAADAPTTFLVGHDAPERTDDRLVSRGTGGELGQGQTFAFDDAVRLTGVTVKVIPNDDHDDVPLTIALYRFTDGEDYVPDEPIIDAGPFSAVSGTLQAGEPGYVTFPLATVELEPGAQYGFVVRGVGNHGEFAFQHLAGDEYDGGRPIVLSGADWRGATLTDDQVFFLHGGVM